MCINIFFFYYEKERIWILTNWYKINYKLKYGKNYSTSLQSKKKLTHDFWRINYKFIIWILFKYIKYYKNYISIIK